jgi:hypothetical protein
LEAISSNWPGSKLLVSVSKTLFPKNGNEIRREIRRSDILTLLEYKRHIDKMQYNQYRQARTKKIPIYAFRDGRFLNIIRVKIVNHSDENGNYARMIASRKTALLSDYRLA